MTARITLALLFVVPAALAYPWRTTADRWVLVVAAAVVIVLFAWWRGLFVTDIVRRRLAMLLRRRRGGPTHGQDAHFATAVLRVGGAPSDTLPLSVLGGYVDRYGIRAHKVRVVSRDTGEERTTWIALTVGAADNLAALQARSARLPLRQTTQIAARRLADHLRELGWEVTPVDETPSPAPQSTRETWRGLRSDTGYVAAYRVAADETLAETLAAVAALPAAETWTAVDITGSATRPEIVAGCAVGTGERPSARGPLPALIPQRGRHRRAVEALHPLADARMEGSPAPVPGDLLRKLSWPLGPPAAQLVEAGASDPQ